MADADDCYKLSLTLNRDVEDIIPANIKDEEFDKFPSAVKEKLNEFYKNGSKKKHKAKAETLADKEKKKKWSLY